MKLELFYCIITICTSSTDCTQFKGELPTKAIQAAVKVNVPKGKEVFIHCGKKEEVEKSNR